MKTIMYKYKLNDLYNALPRSITTDTVLAELKKYKIKKGTFYKDCGIKLKDRAVIKSDRLDIYAALFGVTVDELKNYEVPKIKPLAERNIRPLAKRLGIRTK